MYEFNMYLKYFFLFLLVMDFFIICNVNFILFLNCIIKFFNK